jgi:hypothetical protein
MPIGKALNGVDSLMAVIAALLMLLLVAEDINLMFLMEPFLSTVN